jgi:hypothetical protein
MFFVSFVLIVSARHTTTKKKVTFMVENRGGVSKPTIRYGVCLFVCLCLFIHSLMEDARVSFYVYSTVRTVLYSMSVV